MKTLFFAVCFCLAGLLSFAQVNPGDKAIDFKLKNVDGKTLSLADFSKEKGIILIFTCNHCPASIACEDRILALDKNFKSKGFPVVAINPNDAVAYPDDSYDNMVKRAKEKGFTFPYLVDESQEIAKKYGATNTPHVFLLAKAGDKFEVKYVGSIDDNSFKAEKVTTKYLETAINELLAGKQITANKTKAIGCTIKWKKG